MTLAVHDIEVIHDILVEWFANTEDPISPPGVRDKALLESAAARPHQTVGQKPAYADEFEKAAALFHSLINNHPFHNGNKRVALVSVQVVLAEDGYWLEEATDEEMYEFARQAASHELTEKREDEIKAISEWLRNASRKTLKGEHPLKFGALRQNLKKFGYEIDEPGAGNLLNVYKDGKIVERISKQGIQGFRPYHTDYISGLRKRLGLIPENGVDSARFYGQKGLSEVASDFIDLRTEVMKKLAKT